MDKKLMFVLFLIFIVVFSFGCKKKEVTDEVEEELPQVTEPGYTFIVNNYPGGRFPIEDFLVSSCGSIECDYTMRNFTWAKVENIEGRELELNLFNEIVNVEVGEDVTYRIFVHKYDPVDKSSKGITRLSVTGDHFAEVRIGDMIGMMYELSQDKEIIPLQIMITKLEEAE